MSSENLISDDFVFYSRSLTKMLNRLNPLELSQQYTQSTMISYLQLQLESYQLACF